MNKELDKFVYVALGELNAILAVSLILITASVLLVMTVAAPDREHSRPAVELSSEQAHEAEPEEFSGPGITAQTTHRWLGELEALDPANNDGELVIEVSSEAFEWLRSATSVHIVLRKDP